MACKDLGLLPRGMTDMAKYLGPCPLTRSFASTSTSALGSVATPVIVLSDGTKSRNVPSTDSEGIEPCLLVKVLQHGGDGHSLVLVPLGLAHW